MWVYLDKYGSYKFHNGCSNQGDLQVGIFYFGLERYLRTLFPTSCTFLVGKREEEVHSSTNTWYTWKTLGTLGILGKHLVYLVHFEKARKEQAKTSKFLGWNGAFVHSLGKVGEALQTCIVQSREMERYLSIVGTTEI